MRGEFWGTENKQSKQCRVDWRSGVRKLRWCLKANPPVECKVFVLVGWLSQGNDRYRFCDAKPSGDLSVKILARSGDRRERPGGQNPRTACARKAVEGIRRPARTMHKRF